jgi:hypothetical protein
LAENFVTCTEENRKKDEYDLLAMDVHDKRVCNVLYSQGFFLHAGKGLLKQELVLLDKLI